MQIDVINDADLHILCKEGKKNVNACGKLMNWYFAVKNQKGARI